MGLEQKSFNKKVHFLGDLNSPKFHSEINWPLVIKRIMCSVVGGPGKRYRGGDTQWAEREKTSPLNTFAHCHFWPKSCSYHYPSTPQESQKSKVWIFMIDVLIFNHIFKKLTKLWEPVWFFAVFSLLLFWLNIKAGIQIQICLVF